MPKSAETQQFSLIALIAPYLAPPRGMQFGPAARPRPTVAELPPGDLAALRAKLLPVIERLNRERADHIRRTENELRLWMAGAGLAGLVLGYSMGGILPGLVLMAGGALFAFLFRSVEALKGPRDAAKNAITAVAAEHLMGFSLNPAPVLTRDEVAAWRLLPRVRTITVDLRLTGQRDEQQVRVSRVGFYFGGDNNAHDKPGDGATFVVVEVAQPLSCDAGRADDGRFALLCPTDAPAQLRAGRGMKPLPTGDATFDERYEVFGDSPAVTPALRAAIPAIEAQARAHRHSLAEVPAGTGQRPAVAIFPGRILVLTPLAKFDGAFEPPPFWQPLDADTLIPAFASDLAILNAHINAALSLAALSLPVGVSS